MAWRRRWEYISDAILNGIKSNQYRYCSSRSHLKWDLFKHRIGNGPQLDQFLANTNNSLSNGTIDHAGDLTKLLKLDPLKPYVKKRQDQIDNQGKHPYIDSKLFDGEGRKVHIEVYGCQMNVNDTEIASKILIDSGYQMTSSISDANVVFLMTCSIRDSAEKKIWKRLTDLKRLKKRGDLHQIGILGCMAERLKTKIIEKEKLVDIVAGPDAYRGSLIDHSNEDCFN